MAADRQRKRAAGHIHCPAEEGEDEEEEECGLLLPPVTGEAV